MEKILLKDITNGGYNKILIIIKEASIKLRIDKLLSHQIKDMSRSEVENAIKNGVILIDGKEVKSKTTITIDLLLNLKKS